MPGMPGEIAENRLLHIDAVTLYNFTGAQVPHTHDCWEICYAVSGRGEFTLNGVRHVISSGDLIIIAPGDSHFERGTIRESMELFFLKVRNDAPVFRALNLPFTGSVFLHTRKEPLIEQVLKNILVERLEEKEGYEFILEAELMKLFVLTGRIHRQNMGTGAGPESLSELIGAKKLNVVSQVKQHIDENPNQEITLSGLSQMFFVSPQHLIRLFKAVTGSTPKQYITQRKIEKAKELLRLTGMKIDRVAEEVGYSNIQYFCRVFKKDTGMTPVAYRDLAKS